MDIKLETLEKIKAIKERYEKDGKILEADFEILLIAGLLEEESK